MRDVATCHCHHARRLLAHPALACALLLTASNLFMTFAWYGHLKNLHGSPWWVAALVSWGIALFEYLLQVPANRIGFTALSLGATEDHAGSDHADRVRAVRRVLHGPAGQARLSCGPAFCLMGAVYFIFRG